MRVLLIAHSLSAFLVCFLACSTGLGKSLHENAILSPTQNHEGMQARIVKAQTSQKVAIATGNTDYVDQAYRNLLSQCSQGKIVNVSSKFTTDLGFLGYENHFEFQGTCIQKL